MKIKTYSRLCVARGSLTPVTTSGGSSTRALSYGEFDNRAHGLSGPTEFIYPMGNFYTEEVVSDPFCEEEVRPTRHMLLHYKLPESYSQVNENAVYDDMKAKSPNPASWNGWNLVVTCHVPCPSPDLVSYYSQWGWRASPSDNGATVYYYVYIFRSDSGGRNQRWFVSVTRYTVTIIPERQIIETIQDSAQMTGYEPMLASMIDDAAVWGKAYNLIRSKPIGTNKTTDRLVLVDSPGEFHSQIAITDLFNERARFNHSGGCHIFEFDWLVQHAFMDACADIGKMNDNMIQNLVEIAKFLWSLCTGDFKNVLEETFEFGEDGMRHLPFDVFQKDVLIGNLGSAWMTYRYQVNTGLMDLDQFSEFIRRRCADWLNFLDSHYYKRSYGHASRTVDGHLVKCTCKLAYRPRTIFGFKAALKYVHETGLELNPYVLWDMIPFSFVVDWFVPIGDVASVMSDAKYYTDEYYDFSEVSFSIKYDMELGSRYFRWYQDPPLIEGYSWFDTGDYSPGPRTVVKRILDSGVMVFGIATGGK